MVATAESIESASQVGLDRLLNDILVLENLTATWDVQQQSTVQALKKAIDALNKETLTRLIRALKNEPAALAALKGALNDDVVYAVLRYHELVKPSLHERLEDALDSVRPYLASHGGNVEVVRLDAPDTVTIRLLGSCDGCPAAGLTLSAGVEKAIEEYCPEITTIKKARGGPSAKPAGEQTVNFVSPFANAKDTGWTQVTTLANVPEGDILCIEAAGHSLLLSRFDTRVTCYENACAHLGMAMDMGSVVDGILTCPHHNFEYSLESGECLTVPEVQLQTHAVRVIGENIEVRFS